MTATRPPRVRVHQVKWFRGAWLAECSCETWSPVFFDHGHAVFRATEHVRTEHRRPSVALCPRCTDPAPPGLDCPCQQPAYAAHRCPQCDEPDHGPCARCERENTAESHAEAMNWRS